MTIDSIPQYINDLKTELNELEAKAENLQKQKQGYEMEHSIALSRIAQEEELKQSSILVTDLELDSEFDIPVSDPLIQSSIHQAIQQIFKLN